MDDTTDETSDGRNGVDGPGPSTPAVPDDLPAPVDAEGGTGSDEHEEPVPSRHRGRKLLLVLAAVAVVAAVVAAIFDTPGLTTFGALLLGLVILRTGWFFLQSFATPPPPPPDRGKLRRVRLVYRCNVCGAEVRMTVANDEDPEPPRHCMDDMQLISPID